ncbi:MAG TPA: DUF4136 domain-containing protein [Steroidobacteraceae bacterium]|jgi:hypothetical protein|nr:DUF4136 domain-containing protein [Steroidobacteraceae bacterium]HNS28496.1 DUF4136 domain-containing protein [Steroidobacteraceae bacterium]
MSTPFAGWTAALATLALVGGCASAPQINVMSDPAANIAAYKTFNYMSPLGTDRGGYESLVSANLKDSTTLELTRRGYQMSETPDFLVNFSGRLDEKLRVSTSPSFSPGMGYYGYRTGFYDPWYGYTDVNVDQYTQGTLNIDIVDAASKRLVWESVAAGRVTAKTREDLPGAIRKIVPEMLAKFPSVGGGPPPTTEK